MHLVATLCNITKGTKGSDDFREGDQWIESAHYNLGRGTRTNGRARVIVVGLDIIGRLAQPRFGEVEVDVDIVKPAAFGQPRVCRGNVIFLFITLELAIFQKHTKSDDVPPLQT